MVARVNTVAFQGMDVIDIDVQVQMAPTRFVSIKVLFQFGLPR